MFRIRYVTLLLFSILSLVSYGQTKISYQFNDEALATALNRISQEEDVAVFYLEKWIEDKRISGNFEANSIQELLSNVLKETGLGIEKYDDYTFIMVNEIRNGQVIEQESASGEKIYRQVIGTQNDQATQAILSGKLVDAQSNEPIFGATIFNEELKVGTITDQNGFFEITLPIGEHSLEISSAGYNDDIAHILLQSDGAFDRSLVTSVQNLAELVITDDFVDENVSEAQLGRNVLKMEDIEFTPSLMGERDVVKAIELLPGVNSNGEAANGYSVRGGNAGQNLILVEGSPVYNPSHLFGLFSVFNPGVVSSATMYKGTMPVQYGGRVSSVLDVNLKDGRDPNWHGEISAGLIASRIFLTGPISEKLSVVTGARVSYVNAFLSRSRNIDLLNSRASFYDTNLKLSYRANKNNQFSINTLISEDQFTLPTGDDIGYGNRLLSTSWKHNFSPNVTGNLDFSFSNYFSNTTSGDSLNHVSIANDITTISSKAQLTFFNFQNHAFTIGADNDFTMINPGRVREQNLSGLSDYQVKKERGLESGLFVDDEIRLTSQLTLNVGLRYSSFILLGAGTKYKYENGQPKSSETLIDSVTFESNEVMKWYGGLEPRVFLSYSIDELTKAKLNFGRSRQYMHVVSNSASISPLSVYTLSDHYLKPQIADQLSLGVHREFDQNPVAIGAEIFLRSIKNLPDYKNGSNLLVNDYLEQKLVSGDNQSYGFELLIEKSNGKVTGWASYSFSRSLNTIESRIDENQINEGRVYASDNDRPHSVSISGDYLITRRWSLSFNWIFNSGRPVSYPEAIYYHNGNQIAYYSDRNEYRIPDYHRLDLSFNWKQANLRKDKKWDISCSFSVYNLYGRANPYSIYFQLEDSRIAGKKLSILAQPIPSFSFNINF